MKTSLLKYVPYLLAVILFFAGRYSAPDNDKEMIRKYESERKLHLEKIHDLNGLLIDKDQQGKEIREKMYSDSVKTANELRANNEAYLKLKKKYNEINLNRANAHTLDSLVSGLYPD